MVQGWAKGLVFHIGNMCLTYRLLTGPESVNWVRITPLMREAFAVRLDRSTVYCDQISYSDHPCIAICVI